MPNSFLVFMHVSQLAVRELHMGQWGANLAL